MVMKLMKSAVQQEIRHPKAIGWAVTTLFSVLLVSVGVAKNADWDHLLFPVEWFVAHILSE